MIILGRKYKFTKFEKYELKKQNYKLSIIKHRDIDPKDVLDQLKAKIDKAKITTLVVNTKVKIDGQIVKYLTKLQFDKSIKIITIEMFVENYLQKCYIPEEDMDLNYLVNIKPFSKWQYIQKRIIDYLGALGLLFFTWPAFFYAKYKIKKESPGDVFFVQERVGINGKLFKCNKFRSMHPNSHHDPYTRENDSRIFPWGNTMRKTRIDELPQLLNVLRGDMHLVGPRAEWSILVENYEKEIPYYSERHIVRPGITGWAQVMYPYGVNIEDTKQKLMYDLYYIKHWSIWLEMKVIWKTILVILGKKGV